MQDDVQVRFFGHASIYIKTPSVSLITDPWFSKTGAFLHSWFQFPDNTELDLAAVRNVDYVVISHEHQDHFDVGFLKTLSPHAKIVIPGYRDRHFYDLVRQAVSNEVIVAPSRQPLRLSDDIRVWPVVQSVPIWDDCAFIFETPLGVIADVNDMKVVRQDIEWIKATFTIDYLFAQYSGASWHPFVYDYPAEAKAAIAEHKVQNKFHNVQQLFAVLDARVLVPCAGPPCFLDDAMFDLNFSRESCFPDQSAFHAFAQANGFSERVLVLLPGDVVDPAQNIVAVTKQNVQHPVFTDKRSYLQSYRERRRKVIADALARIPAPAQTSLLERCQEHFTALIRGSRYFRTMIDGAILFDLTGPNAERIVVDFTNAQKPIRAFNGEKVIYTYTLESRFLNLILEHKIAFEDLFLSLRFRASRTPDMYNEFLTLFLKFMNATNLVAYEEYEKQKQLTSTFLLEYDGKKYEVQRYCPHAMGDLSKGKVQDGCLVCPVHAWKFALPEGAGVGNSSAIRIKRAE